jgi:hypothetical protein
MTNINDHLLNISILSPLIPLFFVVFLKEKNRLVKIIGYYSFYCLFSDLVLTWASISFFRSETYAFRVFTLLEYFFLTYLLINEIENSRAVKTIKYASTLFITVFILDWITSSFHNFDSIPTGLESLIILSSSIYLVYEKTLKIDALVITPSTWVSFGFIIYFAGTFFLFILSQNNLNDENFYDTYGVIVSIFNTIKNLFLTIGVFRISKTTFMTSKYLSKY